jgi:predicted RNA-binding protein YlqC (UPF0109 family)
MAFMSELKDYIEYVVKSVVDNPDEVRIKEMSGEQAVVYELRVDKRDLGMVIGKHGQNIVAIRTLLRAVSAKAGKKRVVLEIIE